MTFMALQSLKCHDTLTRSVELQYMIFEMSNKAENEKKS